jgi:hypothetical protein
MFKLLKEKFESYFLSPLRLFFFRRRPDNKNTYLKFWLALTAVVALTITGMILARLFMNLTTVEPPVDDRSFLGQLKAQAQKFINFAGNNFQETDRRAEERATAIRAEKIALEQKKLEEAEKFSRVTFFYTAPYLGSVAIPAAWEKKYRVAEENNTVDFYYTPGAEEEYLLFRISILSREEWEKKQAESNNFQVLAIVSNFVFFNKIYAEKINNPVKQTDYDGMQKQVKSVLDSFKSYKQE